MSVGDGFRDSKGVSSEGPLGSGGTAMGGISGTGEARAMKVKRVVANIATPNVAEARR
jgi:hypothetical protein